MIDGKKITVKSIKIFKPQISKFNTNFATLIIEEDDKLDILKKIAKEPDTDLNKLFVNDDKKKPFINLLHPKKYHKNYIQMSYIKRFTG